MSQGIRRCLLVGALLASVASRASGQAVLGLGDDALTLPRGVIRIRALSTLTTFDQRYGKNTVGRPDGSLEQLATDFNIDTVGLTQFPTLAPVQSALRALTGIPDFTVSLGRTQVSANAIVNAVPLVFEAGLTDRFSLGIIVPIVQARNSIGFRTNPGGRDGNVGFNPVRAGDTVSSQRNAAIVGQLTTAQTQLTTLIATCTSNPSALSGCPQILANGPALTASTQAFRQGVGGIYGTSTAAGANGAPFVPVAGTEAHEAIVSRIEGFRALYAQFGISAIDATTRPTPAAARISTAGANRILVDSAFGIRAQPLGSVMTTALGDIEVGLKFRLYDSFGIGNDTARFLPRGVNVRQSFTGVFRAGTGRFRNPDNFVDLGTGNGQNDLEARSLTDILLGRHLFTSIVLRYVYQMEDTEVMRITDQPDRALAPIWRRREVTRNLGDQVELEITPRWVISDFLSIGGQYFYRRKGEDSFTGTFTVPTTETGLPTPVTLDANTLRFETAATEHRLGAGLMFSSVAAYARGKAKFPVELQISQSRTTRGAGGNTPKLTITTAQLRFYGRIFGGK